ncbi:flavin reductase family protein [Pectinatus frisingensis]|jgi:flavin reductase (DIM6/NTAB) family NADH-FMN oxidoreductase RutF|uniref:flavin reductase family protein n=1 Tax=Pectinatus frisingensis TaxID=865 RepID=UPI0018C7BBD0|nr:flavin reductase family protein [Pectinatus frisingensis]
MPVINPLTVADKVTQTLKTGVFLTTQVDGKADTMTIGWGSVGLIWGKPVFTVMVRRSRYTWSVIEKSHEFTVSVPTHDMSAAIKLCGTKSARDIDKFEAAGLTAQKGKLITTPVIAGAGMHFECKVLYKQDMIADNLDKVTAERWYGDNDWHTLYFGEIVTAYED